MLFIYCSRAASLIQSTYPSGKPILIEDCNDQLPIGKFCPGNFFRSGGDLFGYWAAVVDRIQTVIPHLGFLPDPNQALSRPGCFAYPDSELYPTFDRVAVS